MQIKNIGCIMFIRMFILISRPTDMNQTQRNDSLAKVLIISSPPVKYRRYSLLIWLQSGY